MAETNTEATVQAITQKSQGRFSTELDACRWAVEMQAYRFGVLVKRMLGYAESSIQNSIRHRAAAMRDAYALRGLRWRDVQRYTPAVLSAAA